MDIWEVLSNIYSFVLTAAIGVIGFFLKRTYGEVDKCVKRDEIVHYTEITKENRNDIKSLNKEYATKEEVAEIKRTIEKIDTAIDEINQTTVKNSEFVRLMTRIETKIDNLSERRYTDGH